MAEQIEWEPLALSLLNLLDKCEIDSEEVTYPIAANVFNGVEMALPADTQPALKLLFFDRSLNDRYE